MAVTQAASSNEEVLDCFQIRHDVFVEEQKVPFVLEIDARDFLDSTIHLLAKAEDRPVGTCRILQDSPNSYHLGRVAVVKDGRGAGLGRALIEAAHDELRKRHSDVVEISLDAQVDAMKFYERLGYESTSRPRFLDAGIWHQEMSRTLP